MRIASAQTELSDEQKREIVAMTGEFNHVTLAYRSVVTQLALREASYFSERLKLPTPHPIRMTDIVYPYPRIVPPWFSLIRQSYPSFKGNMPSSVFTTNIYSTNISREARLRAVEIGLCGIFGTTNVLFCFNNGQLMEVMRIDGPDDERYSRHLEDLAGKVSLINDVEAYQLATQWLAAVDVDMAALAGLKWSVNQLHFRPRGTTNTVKLPLYYIDFNYTNQAAPHTILNLGEPPLSVEILGSTKELQDLKINDLSFSRRPLLLITNAFDLVRTPNPTFKEPIKRAENVRTNSPPQ